MCKIFSIWIIFLSSLVQCWTSSKRHNLFNTSTNFKLTSVDWYPYGTTNILTLKLSKMLELNLPLLISKYLFQIFETFYRTFPMQWLMFTTTLPKWKKSSVPNWIEPTLNRTSFTRAHKMLRYLHKAGDLIQ